MRYAQFISPLLTLVLLENIIGCRHETNVMIHPGTKMTEVMSLLADYGIEAELNQGHYALPGDPPAKRFRVLSRESPDALFLIFSQRGSLSDYILDVMYWHWDYQADAKLAGSKRREDVHNLQEIELRDLKNWVATGNAPSLHLLPRPRENEDRR